MKRLFFFALMVPLAGLFPTIALFKTLLNTWFAVDGGFGLLSLAVACAFGIAPALVCLIADWLFKDNRDRIFVAAFLGVVVEFAICAFCFRSFDGPYAIALIAAVCSGVIAAVCSWQAGRAWGAP
jgi:hypothetical protein